MGRHGRPQGARRLKEQDSGVRGVYDVSVRCVRGVYDVGVR